MIFMKLLLMFSVLLPFNLFCPLLLFISGLLVNLMFRISSFMAFLHSKFTCVSLLVLLTLLFPIMCAILRKLSVGWSKFLEFGFHLFSSFFLTLGFAHSQSNPSMFILLTTTHILILLLYVDDIMLTGSSSSLLFSFITLLTRQFAMNDPSDIHHLLDV